MSEPTNLELEERNGAIVIKLRDSYAILTPDQAKEIGETMQKYAYHAKYGSDPKTKSMMAEQIRAKMKTRVAHVIRSLENKKKPPHFIANEIVDILVGEVL